ncbi:unnamed protein product, partial [Notodromas monacha]
MPEADQNNRNRSGLGNSRFEINFRRLLKVCEAHTAKFVKAIEINSEEADVFPSWRLSKYIGTLEGLLEEMKKGASELYIVDSVDADVLKENEKKVKYLRSVCPVYVGAFSSASACDDDDHSPKKLSPLTDSSLVMSSGHFSPRGVQQAPDTPTGRVIESTLRATLEESARRELIGDPFPETGLRNRHNAGMSNDVDAILSAHQAEQDRVAEEMLHLAQSLKEQSQAAKAIICKDKD